MSVLDKLNNVSIDPSTVVNVDLRERITATAQLAEQYVNLSRKAHTEFVALHDTQKQVLLDLDPGNEYGSTAFYRNESYGNQLNFTDYEKDVYMKLVEKIQQAVCREYNVAYEIRETTSRTIVEKWLTDGLNLNDVYVHISEYLEGKTFAQVQNAETFKKFTDHVIRRYSSYGVPEDADIFTKRTFLTVGAKDVTIHGFVSTDWNGVRLSSSAEYNLHTLTRYFTKILGDELVFGTGAIDVTFGDAYVPQKSLQSIVKNIRVFKNNNLKITFHSEAGLKKFLEPILEEINNTEVK